MDNKGQFMVVVDGEGIWVQGYTKAYNGAMMASLESEQAVGLWQDGELLHFFRDGEEVDIQAEMDEDFADDYDEPYDIDDEIGYNPYMGCFDGDC